VATNYGDAVGSLDSLLTVQDIDTSLDQLRHRRDTLAERAELVEAIATARAASDAVDDTYGRLHQVQQAQKALEDESATAGDKAAHVDRMLYGGTVKAAKELEAYQVDLALLQARVASIDDQVLELMEQAEPLEAELVEQREALAAAESAVASAEDRLVVAEAEIDAEVDRVAAGRADAVAGLPAEVVELYEALRRSLGGVGAARLHGARCEGCHLEIPSAELEGIRHAPDDTVPECPECGRILVR